MGESIAEISDGRLHITLQTAEPLTLHTPDFPRTDGNSPVLSHGGGAAVFFSHYQPRGHTYRRMFSAGLRDALPPQPVRWIDDPAPAVGKWIEAVWRDPGGRLCGCYHAEDLIEGPPPLFVPHIGACWSDDNGLTWHGAGDMLRSPPHLIDPDYRNGFLAGGYGDCCVIPDRDGSHLILAFSSYVADEAAQGVAMARFPNSWRDRPASALELWTASGWMPAAGQKPAPLWPVRHGWRHSDPDSFWGPAIHYNRQLDAFVMLLNHTAGGDHNILQEGIYASVTRTPEDPASWSLPMRLVAGGAWYPQVIGLTMGSSDSVIDGPARFFMAGYSAWTIAFAWASTPERKHRVLNATKPLFYSLFGDRHPAPW